AGADDYLGKPVNILELKTRIRGALKTRELQKSLKSANRTISVLTNYSTNLITQFNPLSYNYEAYLQHIIDLFLKNTNDFIRNKPWGILSGRLNESYLYGELFYKDDNEIIRSVSVNITANIFFNESLFKHQIYFENDSRGKSFEIRTKDEYKRIEISNFAAIRIDTEMIILFNFEHKISHYDTEVFNYILMLCEFFKRLSLQIKDTENAFKYAVEALSRAAEANDEDTGNHIIRVNAYSIALAKELKQSDKFIDEIGLMAQMHDVGKIHIHPDILRKSGALTNEEFAEIKKHPYYGAKILGDEQRLRMAKNIALTHHEKADGSGYPNGLKKENIPLEGKIVAIADIYDALRHPRSYKPAFSHEKTVSIITKGDGRTLPSHFDPQILETFIRVEKIFEEIYNKLK
ncbi:MAG: HD domain-containing protein, partial [Deltaproteobacteria bacterium]|nr:HD domain-containing protein [Deltaproteobacteria bacterium]